MITDSKLENFLNSFENIPDTLPDELRKYYPTFSTSSLGIGN